jgi:predicted GTPase
MGKQILKKQDGMDERYTEMNSIHEISEFLRKKQLLDTLEDATISYQKKVEILLLEEGIQKSSLTNGLFLEGF